jgi:NADH-quinone oxidoreductase subunit J
MNTLIFSMIIALFIIVFQKDPVFAVFSFIIIALISFFLLTLIGAEFLALLILIIYTGVITVLFLFVVIMYNLRNINIYIQSLVFNPFVSFLIYKIFWFNKICNNLIYIMLYQNYYSIVCRYNLDVIKFIDLFNEYHVLFLYVGLILLVAMIGSVVITYPFYKQQL